MLPKIACLDILDYMLTYCCIFAYFFCFVFSKQHHTLATNGIRRLTFVVLHRREFPKYFTYRSRRQVRNISSYATELRDEDLNQTSQLFTISLFFNSWKKFVCSSPKTGFIGTWSLRWHSSSRSIACATSTSKPSQSSTIVCISISEELRWDCFD